MRRVWIYTEGNSRKYHNELRDGFREFLDELRTTLKPTWDIRIAMCGSRWDAFDDFKIANSHATKDDFFVLLIDSEWEVTKTSPWQHLAEKETWKMKGLADDQCYLMVQTTEAWFFADIPAVHEYYGQHFNRNAMGNTDEIENVSKQDLNNRLANATASKQNIKGKYHKGNHSGALLRKIDPKKVRKASPHCERIFIEIPAAVAKF